MSKPKPNKACKNISSRSCVSSENYILISALHCDHYEVHLQKKLSRPFGLPSPRHRGSLLVRSRLPFARGHAPKTYRAWYDGWRRRDGRSAATREKHHGGHGECLERDGIALAKLSIVLQINCVQRHRLGVQSFVSNVDMTNETEEPRRLGRGRVRLQDVDTRLGRMYRGGLWWTDGPSFHFCTVI